ncbi:hypothetical protein FO519_004457 [Halicephalobus sp. NKZ332]|nr:hypothetical protein FO519_004457 [Halicephalobus sp. NKZ332]
MKLRLSFDARLFIFLFTLLIIQIDAAGRSVQTSVQKAIENTKRRQTPTKMAAVPNPPSSQQRPGRMERLDVDKLNLLIKSIDKTWIMPRAGTKDPVGSNFQYKKTCSSIYKARHGACQQPGFGVMCFNYCHEQGEKLVFRCQDTSDANYCRNSGSFDTFLAKYRKDSYKAKAFIHQMISRCYATAICNLQTGILNSTLIDSETVFPEDTTPRAPPALIRGAARTLSPIKGARAQTQAPRKLPTRKPSRMDTTSPAPAGKTNIWDRFTIAQRAKPTPKYIPFWQRLLATTTISPSTEPQEITSGPIKGEIIVETQEPEEEEASITATTRKMKKVTLPTRKSIKTTTKAPTEEPTTEEEEVIEETSPTPPDSVEEPKPIDKHTWKPLEVTDPPPIGPEYRSAKTENQEKPAFWNKFQPNRWYQSTESVFKATRFAHFFWSIPGPVEFQSTKKMFTNVDFVIFGIFLTLSMVVGVYHAVMAKIRGKNLDHSETAEFLTGGRKLPILPVCLSLLTTFISGIALLGLPAEIYQRGVTTGISVIGGGVSFILTGVFFIPIFYKLQLISVYEYLELRFDSKLLRKIGSGLFMMSTLFYMAVVMYAPSVALAGVTDIDLWPFILSIGVVATIYTAIGGIKAVIWTDTLQAVFMYVGIGTLIIKGTMDSGGFFNVLDVAEKGGRLSTALLRFDPTIFQYNSFWITFVCSILHWTCFYGLNQMALQRYCSMSSLKNARIVMALTVPALWAIGLMCTFIGILLLAYFHGCDPVALGEINSMDQMSILMAGRVLSIIPGLPGLFLAALFSSTLSTTSSGMNSMTAVLFEDFFKDKCQRIPESRVTLYMKLVTILFGVLSTLLAFACDYMGGIFNAATTTLGAAAGPLVGLFFLGLFFPRANKIGAFAGLSAASVLMLLCSISNHMEKPYKNYVLPLVQNVSNSNCVDFNPALPNHTDTHISVFKHHTKPQEHEIHQDWHYGDPGTSLFARTSPFTYAFLSVITVVVVGYFVSLIFPTKLDPRKRRTVLACTYSGNRLEIDKDLYQSVALFHAIFSSAGDIEANCLNFMNVPLRHFFNESLYFHYGIDASDTEFNLIFSIIASTMFIGVIVGGLSIGYLMDFYGRKGTAIYVRSFLSVLSAICMIGARYLLSVELFVVGHFLAGVVCTLKVVLFIYMTECAPDDSRGIAGMAIGSGGALIMLAVQPLCLPSVFGNDSRWTGLPAVCLIMAVIHLFGGTLFPESPKHLYITENKKSEATAAVKYYHGDDADIALVEEEYEREKEIMALGHISLKQVWANETLRWSFLICVVCSMVSAASAVGIRSQYQISMYLNFGMTQEQGVLAIMIISFVTFPLCLISPVIIEKAGRRPLFLSVSGLCITEWLFLMIAQSMVDMNIRVPLITSTIGIIGTLAGQVAVMLGLLILTPIMIGELCPHVARAPIGQFVQVVPMIFSLLSVVAYPVTVANFGALYFLPFLLISSFLWYLIYQNLPETTGLPVDRIVRRLTITARSRGPSMSALLHGTVSHSYGTLVEEDGSTIIPETRD